MATKQYTYKQTLEQEALKTMFPGICLCLEDYMRG